MTEGAPGPAVSEASPNSVLAHVQGLLAQEGLRQGLVMFGATSLANVLDYAYNVAMGRLLSTAGYGVYVSLQALLQIVAVSLVVVRTVIARYVVAFAAEEQGTTVGGFVRRALHQTALWGAIAVVVLSVLSQPVARLLQIPTVGPVLVMAAALLPMMVKPAIEGTLQGLQRFTSLGVVQVAHAAFRLLLGILLVRLGLDALGAMAALPGGTTGTIVLGVVLLWGILSQRGDAAQSMPAGLTRFAGKTIVGLVSFAALINMDALIVKHYFPPTEAGYYSMAVTLGKIVIFLPTAFAVVLFPKSAERHLRARDTSRLLRLSLAVTLLPCAGLAALYFALPDWLLGVVFGAQNPFAGPVLGLVALSMSGYALVNVWLNYTLSVEEPGFVYTLPFALVVQLVLLVLFHASLVQVATVVALTSLGLLVAAEGWFRLRSRTAAV